jgi:SAM-dependent methyltransferase
MMSWEMVDEGWGRRAADFATFAEPSHMREYVSMHERLGLREGDRLLDAACGSGLQIELARLRGAICSGIDASPRLVAVAKHRNRDSDVRVGDMQALPWDDASFDIVTSFRGIWGTTPGAVEEAHRVLVPGGRVAMTIWGDVGKSPGAWMLTPFLWANEEKVRHQADMVSLGHPGVGESFLADRGFEPEERFEITFVFEFSDPGAYARAMASMGPSYESIQDIGEDEFHTRAVELASGFVREGLPLRGELQLFGYIGVKH